MAFQILLLPQLDWATVPQHPCHLPQEAFPQLDLDNICIQAKDHHHLICPMDCLLLACLRVFPWHSLLFLVLRRQPCTFPLKLLGLPPHLLLLGLELPVTLQLQEFQGLPQRRVLHYLDKQFLGYLLPSQIM